MEAFLTDQLRVDSGTGGRSPEHQQLCYKGNEIQEKLAKKLNNEEKEMLTELVDTLFKKSCFDEQKKFERGFRLGVLTTAEAWAAYLFPKGNASGL